RAAEDGNAGREIVDAEDTRGAAAAICSGAEPAGDRDQFAAEHGGGEHVPQSCPAGRTGLAVTGRVGRRAVGGGAVSASAGGDGGAAAGAGLGGCAPRVAAPQHDAVAALGGLCQEDAQASCCTRDEGGPFEVAL